MNLSPNEADVVFLVLEVYQEQISGDLLMNAQKCQLSDGVAVRSSSNFRLTCPVSEVYNLQNAIIFASAEKGSTGSPSEINFAVFPIPAASRIQPVLSASSETK